MTNTKTTTKQAEIRFRQWKVDAYGLDTIRDQYQIEKSRLAETRLHDRTLADWPAHMAEKNWVDLEDFITAWLAAVLIHNIPLGAIDVGRSIVEARRYHKYYSSHTAEPVP